MKKTLMFLACAVFALGLTAGCGGGSDDNAAEQTEEKAADHPRSEHPVGEPASEDTTDVSLHDCAGPCGMKDVPEDQLTMVDGKMYCAGCVEKARADAAKKGDHPQ